MGACQPLLTAQLWPDVRFPSILDFRWVGRGEEDAVSLVDFELGVDAARVGLAHVFAVVHVALHREGGPVHRGPVPVT